MIAALYVETGGIYYGLPNVDPWDAERDARLYDGPYPVVAHPPCSRWCMLASVNQARWGKQIGDDDGCFQAALEAVRKWGGVLEHPAYSLAWDAYGLPKPGRHGWATSLFHEDDGCVTEVSQSAYGHLARKRTWLYMVGCEPRELRWRDTKGYGVVGAGIHSGECEGRPRVEGYEARATPLAFRDELIGLAETASRVWAT